MWLCYSPACVLHGAPEEREPALHGVCFGKLRGATLFDLQPGQAPPPLATMAASEPVQLYITHIDEPAFLPLTVHETMKATASRVDVHLVATGLTHDQAWECIQYLREHGAFEALAIPMRRNLLASDIFRTDWNDALELR
jgi:hypothetical protein